MRTHRYILSLLLCFSSFFVKAQNQPLFHPKTNWIFATSIKYDAFCFINVLMGEEFYTKHYPKAYRRYDSLVTPGVRKSLDDLKQYKNKRGMILSAFLTSCFYRLPDSSLQTLIDDLENKPKIKRLVSPGNYEVYKDIRKDLVTVLRFLLQSGFEQFYQTDVLPVLRKKISSLQEQTKQYNVVAAIEGTVGIPLAEDTIRFYVMRYSSPHGISINTTNFLSEVSYDLQTTMKVAVHEMMHPYFNEFTPELKKAIKTLKSDSLIYNAFLHHDKKYGYNDLEGYIAEACVRALEQEVSAQLGIGTRDNQHWKTEDEGMHVFGAILIQKMKEHGFPGSYKGNFASFLQNVFDEVKGQGGKAVYEQLFSDKG